MTAQFLKLSGGWINPEAIRWAEPVDDGEAMVVSVAGREAPIRVAGEDADTVQRYLDSRPYFVDRTAVRQMVEESLLFILQDISRQEMTFTARYPDNPTSSHEDEE